MAHTNKTYKEGYVPGKTREVTPVDFDPLQGTPVDPIERPIIVRTSGLIHWQDIVSTETFADGDYISDDSFDTDPLTGSYMSLTVNGQVYLPADGEAEVSESAFYVTDSTGTTVRTQGTFVSGDRFRWNGSVAGYQIETDDVLKISYET